MDIINFSHLNKEGLTSQIERLTDTILFQLLFRLQLSFVRVMYFQAYIIFSWKNKPSLRHPPNGRNSQGKVESQQSEATAKTWTYMKTAVRYKSYCQVCSEIYFAVVVSDEGLKYCCVFRQWEKLSG